MAGKTGTNDRLVIAIPCVRDPVGAAWPVSGEEGNYAEKAPPVPSDLPAIRPARLPARCASVATDTIGTALLDLRERSTDVPERGALRLDGALDRVERDLILRALEETKQLKARAARLLGVSERSLWYKLKKHGL